MKMLDPILVENLVKNSVRDLSWFSVQDLVRDLVRDSVRNSVRYSIRISVWISVYDLVWNTVRVSDWDSVWILGKERTNEDA